VSIYKAEVEIEAICKNCQGQIIYGAIAIDPSRTLKFNHQNMTRTTNARLAGIAFLTYIAGGITSLTLSSQIMNGAEETASKLANMARHESTMQVIVLLTLLQAACALVLAVTLYALTRDLDRDLAVMALCCRAGEGLIAVIAPVGTLALFSLAMTGTGSANAAGELLFKIEGWTGIIAAICFSVGSTIYTFLFLRARSIPVLLAWLGVFASILLVVVLPLQLSGLVEGMLTKLIWLPMLVFELAFAIWLLIRGGAMPSTQKAL
jgi:hypothetical protein